ncbi:MAG: alpha/beta fold hydrolase [Lachnospiraceae bacterium]|nr:alpha/beta fold hydrolase [Lachnospiraceae bacterium]
MIITDDGIRLNARLDMPGDGAAKCPIMIIIHGFTGHMEEAHLNALSDALNEAGYATLRADMYGHGKSEGSFREHTLFKWMTNAMTLIDYARGLDFVTDIYLCGHSQGGLTAILAAGLKHEFIKGLVALSPAAMIPELARNGTLLGAHFDPANLPEELTVWDEHTLGNNYIRVAQMIHVEEYIDKYPGPVLVVQGTEDMPDLIDSAKAAARRYANARYVEIAGDTHVYDHHVDRMTAAVVDWLKG